MNPDRFSTRNLLIGFLGLVAAIVLPVSDLDAAQTAANKKGTGQGNVTKKVASVPAEKSGGPSAVGPSQLTDQILLDLEAKRRAISQREIDLRREEDRLKELRADIKKRIANLKQIEGRLQKSLEKMDSASKKSITHLVKAYSAMGPDEAAQLMNTMDINLAVRILRNMQVKKAGAILAVVEPRRAARISEKLARAKIK